jgi:hypothetical protein
VSPEVQVCCRCFFVWLNRESLRSLGLKARNRSATREAAALAQIRAMGEPGRAVPEARDTIVFALAAAQGVAEALESALDESAA